MSGKTNQQKAEDAKKAAEGIETKKKEIINKISVVETLDGLNAIDLSGDWDPEVKKEITDAFDKKNGEIREKEEKESAKAKEGFFKEISDKINAAEKIEDLEALNGRVYDIWGDDVPIEIQELATKKGQEIELNNLLKAKIFSKKKLQEGWVKVTDAEVKAAEKSGKLAGFDDKTMTAKINK